MGGIVKSIGKAIKGIGKAIKKILPILLVAAAVYIGYGYMTGFQAGGWPQITNWGKSLVAGVGQGQTISTAATAATDMTAMAGAQTAAIGAETATAGAALGAAETGASTFGADALTTALPAQEAITATALPATDIASTGMIGQAGGDVASAGMIDGMGLPAGAEAAGPASNWALDSIAQTQTGINSMYQEFGAGWTDTTKGILADLNAPSPISSAQAAGFGPNTPPFLQGTTFDPALGGASPAYPGVGETTSLSDVASINQAAADQVMSAKTWTPDTITGTGPQLSTLPNDPRVANYMSPNQMGTAGNIASHLDPTEKGTFFSKLAQLGKKGWEAYKKMWASNPGMAMWTTSNVLKTILAMLDDTDEKLAHRRAHVGGFAPGGYDEVAARYHGNLPGGRGGGAGYTAARGRSGLIKTGPISEGNRGRSSAVDTRPAKEYRSTQQGQV